MHLSFQNHQAYYAEVAEQRKAKRFPMRLPVELVRAGTRIIHGVGETRDMSTLGVLFTTAENLSPGDVVEYLITLPKQEANGPIVRMRCLGRVVRLVPATNGEGSAMAATLERYEMMRGERGDATAT